MALAVAIKDLYKQYKGAWAPALDSLSVSVEQGHITGLLGPNGAGKSTTINILCGLITPDKGTVKVMGLDATKETAALRREIGVVPQQIALFSNLTAWENFRYIGRLYGLSEQETRQRARHLLERLGLDKHAGKRIGRYSGGMKRRANIIASLLHQPNMLILDEPTAGVDVQSRAMILKFLEAYNREGKTILYTSHLMEEAEQICDEVIIIDEGKFVISGAPKQLIQQTEGCKRLEDVFLHYTGHSLRD
jgi:ABC-2 type transport system ATP-binding protein